MKPIYKDLALEFNRNNKNQCRIKELSWQKIGLCQTASGYGDKLVTRYQVFYKNRWYRVYCRCYSNSGVLYIIIKNIRYYIDIY